MSFLDEIRNFKLSSLRHSDTFVTTPGGLKYHEDKTCDQHTKPITTASQFFVFDHKPDLQVGEILPYLYLGSADVAGDFQLLESLGVTHILNVTTLQIESFPDKFVYYNVPLLDIPQENLLDKLEQCFKFIDSSRSCNGKVLVHCMAGISRSASVVIAYIMRESRLTFEEAIQEVRQHRPAANPNEGFRKQLMTFKP